MLNNIKICVSSWTDQKINGKPRCLLAFLCPWIHEDANIPSMESKKHLLPLLVLLTFCAITDSLFAPLLFCFCAITDALFAPLLFRQRVEGNSSSSSCSKLHQTVGWVLLNRCPVLSCRKHFDVQRDRCP